MISVLSKAAGEITVADIEEFSELAWFPRVSESSSKGSSPRQQGQAPGIQIRRLPRKPRTKSSRK